MGHASSVCRKVIRDSHEFHALREIVLADVVSTLRQEFSLGGRMKYRIALHESEKGYSVSVPGLPGCWSQGTTEAEAIENIRDAIRKYLSVVDDQLRGENIREVEVTV